MVSPFKEIRLADISDVENIQLCANQAYEKYIELIGKKPAPMVDKFDHLVEKNTIFVADDSSGQLMGYVIFYPDQNRMHLSNITVFSRYQGQGIGKKLIAFCEDEARQLKLDAVVLYTNEKMFDNLNMYPHLGYLETGRKTEDGFNRVYFEKNL